MAGLTMGADRFGANLAGVAAIFTERRCRRWASGQKKFFHRPRNGAHDPLTQFHVLLALMEKTPNERFSAKQLTSELRASNKFFSWDAVTVGRIVTDFIDSIKLAYGDDARSRPILSARHWSGNYYFISDLPEAREILARLADDLYEACEETIEAEAAGTRVSRLDSPLGKMPSLHRVDLS